MKKIIAVILALTLIFSITACGKKGGSNTPAGMLNEAFSAIMKDGKLTSTEDIANDLITNEIIPFMGATMPVEEGYLNGFSSEIEGFDEGTMFGPVIGSIPFIGYVFKTADSDSANALAETLKANHDLAWNICTQADEMICETNGNYVFFVMAPATFED